jgi:hypothetical protein
MTRSGNLARVSYWEMERIATCLTLGHSGRAAASIVWADGRDVDRRSLDVVGLSEQRADLRLGQSSPGFDQDL